MTFLRTLLRQFLGDINREDYYNLHYPKLDRTMIVVLWSHFVAVALFTLVIYVLQPAAYSPGPFSWRVLSFTETTWVIILAGLAALIPTLLCNRLPSHYIFRLIVTLCLLVYSYIIVFASGGSIEGHFHFFVILLLLVLYYDWRLAWVGLVAVALHHGILNYTAPDWVYYYGRNDVSVVAHALPVLLIAIVNTWIAERGRAQVKLTAAKNEELENVLRQKIPGLSK